MLKVLIVTNLFQNTKEPTKAQYHTQQFRELAKIASIQIVSPVPFFRFSKQDVPMWSDFEGTLVCYPRYFVIPKILRRTYPFFFYHGIKGVVNRILRKFDFDVIFVPWVFPDGVACQKLGIELKKPVVIDALGSDINLNSVHKIKSKMIVQALNQCAKVVSVSQKLKEKMTDMGVYERHIEVLSNGVNSKVFYPREINVCREQLGLSREKKIILYMGNLVHVKGPDVLIDVFVNKLIKGNDASVELAVVGDGRMRIELEDKVKRSGLKDVVRFYGRSSYENVSIWMNAADVLCLPSRNEGHPNVVMESLACGTPVVATDVGAVADILVNEDLGLISNADDLHDLSEKLTRALDKQWNRTEIVEHVQNYSWKDNARKLKLILEEVTC